MVYEDLVLCRVPYLLYNLSSLSVFCQHLRIKPDNSRQDIDKQSEVTAPQTARCFKQKYTLLTRKSMPIRPFNVVDFGSNNISLQRPLGRINWNSNDVSQPCNQMPTTGDRVFSTTQNSK